MAGSVQQRGKDSWRLVVSLGLGADGKYIMKRKTVKAKNKTKAEKLLAEFVTELEAGEYIEPSRIKFNDYVEVWRKHAAKQLAPRTIETYDYMLNARAIPALAHIKMENITHDHVNDFLEGLEEEELSTSTMQKYFNVLSNIFKYAVFQEVIKKNPMLKVNKPSVKYKEGQVYNKEELEQLYQLLDSEENKQMVLLIHTALKTGMRKGELLALRKSDLDFEKNTIHIKHSLSYTKDTGYLLKEPKTNGSNRIIGIPASLMKELKKHIFSKYDSKENSIELWQGGNDIFVFSADLGEPFHPNSPATWWKRFLERTQFKKIRFHDLRHCFATELMNRGANINKVSKYLGHASITTTMDIYSHLVEEDREIADLMEEDYI